MNFFNRKSNIVLTFAAGMILGWGLFYTNCGRTADDTASTPIENKSTQQLAESGSVGEMPQPRVEKDFHFTAIPLKTGGEKIVVDQGFSFEQTGVNTFAIVDDSTGVKQMGGCKGSCKGCCQIIDTGSWSYCDCDASGNDDMPWDQSGCQSRGFTADPSSKIGSATKTEILGVGVEQIETKRGVHLIFPKEVTFAKMKRDQFALTLKDKTVVAKCMGDVSADKEQSEAECVIQVSKNKLFCEGSVIDADANCQLTIVE